MSIFAVQWCTQYIDIKNRIKNKVAVCFLFVIPYAYLKDL